LNLEFDKKRELMLRLFQGKDPYGRRYAIYIYRTKKGFTLWMYASLGFDAVGEITTKKGTADFEIVDIGNLSKEFIPLTS